MDSLENAIFANINQTSIFMNQKISRYDFPYDFLENYGLTQEMIEDLPESVLTTIEAGLFSPLLPIYIKQPWGKTKFRAKFRLEKDEEGIRVLFYMKKSEADFSKYNLTDEQLNSLKQGKVILSYLEQERENELGEPDIQKLKCFIQLDRSTNCVICVPTPAVARNLQKLADFYDLSNEDIENILNGELISVHNEEDDVTTIGIDLHTTTCARAICCTKEQWPSIVDLVLPVYSFGNDGCWVNKDGVLDYVPENEFTDDINEALLLSAKLNGYAREKSSDSSTIQQPDSLHQEEAAVQQESFQMKM